MSEVSIGRFLSDEELDAKVEAYTEYWEKNKEDNVNDFKLGERAASRELAVLETLYDHGNLSFAQIRSATGIYPAKLGITLDDLSTAGFMTRGNERLFSYSITALGKSCVEPLQGEKRCRN